MAKTVIAKENTIVLTLRTGKEAFQDGNMRSEVIRILFDAGRKIANGENLPLALLDYNGNRVGEITGRLDP